MVLIYEKNGKKLPYKIIKTNNLHTYFKVKQDYIEIKVGTSTSLKKALEILSERFEYFYKAFNHDRYLMLDDNEITLEQQKYHLIINEDKTFNYYLEGNTCYVKTNLSCISKIKYQIYLSHILKMYEKIYPKLIHTLNENEIALRKIIFKHFKTRYGSYHIKDDVIKLNVILAKGSLDELLYVLLHEYAHTKVYNHSKKFYDLLEKLMIDYKIYDKSVKNIPIYL